MRIPRVLVADDHEAIAFQLVRLLSGQFEILGPIRDGGLVVDTAIRLRPDVVLLDLSMPHIDGLEALRQLKQVEPDFRILIVTMYGDAALAQEAMKRGASGFVLKSELGQELLVAIEAVLSGRRYLAPSLKADVEMLTSVVADPTAVALTTQQRDVLGLLVHAQRTREIASVLDMPVSSVAAIKETMMRRLGVQSTAELVQYTIDHRLLA
jgi:DNA-binding NarL/FixJ family response regulator